MFVYAVCNQEFKKVLIEEELSYHCIVNNEIANANILYEVIVD